MPRIERETRGLGITPSMTSDNLTPQENTSQEVGETALDGGGLPCPGSSVVAEESGKTDSGPQGTSGESW